MIVWGLLWLFAGHSSSLWANEDVRSQLSEKFEKQVSPFLQKYCLNCHGADRQEAKLDLSGTTSLSQVVKDFGRWEVVLDRIQAGEMPPVKSLQPEMKLRGEIIEWIEAVRKFEAARSAGDPGTVLARRLSHAEFNYTIRDLTGVDIRPTREFPVDPSNESGFDNSGESLTMTPALLKKYLAATRLVADHIVLKPEGFEFAPHPVVADTDRDKYCVQRIVDFYQQHEVDYSPYFLACWQYRYRDQAGLKGSRLIDFIPTGHKNADRPLLSGKYLELIWSALHDSSASGPLADLQVAWSQLPDDYTKLDQARADCDKLRDLVLRLRKDLDQPVDKLHMKQNSDGSQPLVLWWNRQVAARRMSYQGDGKDASADRARARFCHVFPNSFFLISRGHYANSNLGAQVRLLTAGFHLMHGYFRDDLPLCELVLDESQKQELDRLWRELDFVTLSPIRQYKDFLFFERAEPPRFAGGPEFDFARPEDKDVTSDSKLQRMSQVYLEKVRRIGASQEATQAVETYFAMISKEVRWVEQAHLNSEVSHLEDLLSFAEAAFRRPLAADEKKEILGFYRRSRDSERLSHEESIRDSVASILMSPYFSYRFDLVPAAPGLHPLSALDLASRLSYFLWSSMPDKELLGHAVSGDLVHPDVLLAQTRRMLGDSRCRALAMEFAGNWLDIRRFDEHNSVDRQRFPQFTDPLRQAMFEEPIRFFEGVVQRDRSILDFLYANDTLVNPVLSRHYGMTLPKSAENDWVRVEQSGRYGRGGLLAMSAFLTHNSPGLRTSPVKRGYWVVRRLLGEQIPAPPPDVPDLPADESKPGELSVPELLARHRQHPNCAACHVRFDAIGLVFEGYGPIGERREKDLGGRQIISQALFPDGSMGEGLEGLKRYIKDCREDDFLENICRKLLAYGLGRGIQLSDQQTLELMETRLRSDSFRFHNLVETIVTSPQFLNKRGQETVPAD